MRTDPGNLEWTNNLAYDLIHLGRLDEARVVVRGLVDAGWSNPDLLELAEERGVLER